MPAPSANHTAVVIRLSQAQVLARRARWRRWAARARAGVAVASVFYDATTVDTLTRLGYLDDDSPVTSEDVGVAIGELIKSIQR
jgi:hypothetical protein